MTSEWGGRREGAGRRPETDETRLARAQERREEDAAAVRAATDALIERIGLPPRRRLLAGEDVEERTDGRWLARFCSELCIQSAGRFAGKPLRFYAEQQAFLDDALSFNDEGERLFSVAVWEVPRKNGKTTTTSALGLALASPAELEGKPKIVLAAGSARQAYPLYESALDFVRGSELLEGVFLASRAEIRCPANGGAIERVAGDGKLNHGLNPYLVAADELHAWVTPKQRENWAALTTADGAREDALIVVITTAGHDLQTLLGQLHAQALESEHCERVPEMGGGGFITRDLDAGLLVHCFAVAPGTPLDDLEEWKRANPAPWRTKQRIASDLAKRHVDEASKRRLYGNEWTSAREVWIRREEWDGLADRDLALSAGMPIGVGVDASHRHDTTAVGWAWPLDDGRIAVRAKVFSVRSDATAHAYFTGDTIRLSAVEAFVAAGLLGASLDEAEEQLARGNLNDGDLAGVYQLGFVGYDPRFFNRSAEMLEEAGVTVVPFEPSSTTMQRAIDEFYSDVVQGRIVHDGDPVLASHVDSASGEKTERGWRVRRLKSSRDIDALIAVVMAADLARHHVGTATADPWVDAW